MPSSLLSRARNADSHGKLIAPFAATDRQATAPAVTVGKAARCFAEAPGTTLAPMTAAALPTHCPERLSENCRDH